MHEIIGYMAAFLSTIAFIPQVVKIYRERSARSISYKTFFIFTAGVTCWLIYGIALESIPMLIANTITIILSVLILLLKYRYRNNDGSN